MNNIKQRRNFRNAWILVLITAICLMSITLMSVNVNYANASSNEVGNPVSNFQNNSSNKNDCNLKSRDLTIDGEDYKSVYNIENYVINEKSKLRSDLDIAKDIAKELEFTDDVIADLDEDYVLDFLDSEELTFSVYYSDDYKEKILKENASADVSINGYTTNGPKPDVFVFGYRKCTLIYEQTPKTAYIASTYFKWINKPNATSMFLTMGVNDNSHYTVYLNDPYSKSRYYYDKFEYGINNENGTTTPATNFVYNVEGISGKSVDFYTGSYVSFGYEIYYKTTNLIWTTAVYSSNNLRGFAQALILNNGGSSGTPKIFYTYSQTETKIKVEVNPSIGGSVSITGGVVSASFNADVNIVLTSEQTTVYNYCGFINIPNNTNIPISGQAYKLKDKFLQYMTVNGANLSSFYRIGAIPSSTASKNNIFYFEQLNNETYDNVYCIRSAFDNLYLTYDIEFKQIYLASYSSTNRYQLFHLYVTDTAMVFRIAGNDFYSLPGSGVTQDVFSAAIETNNSYLPLTVHLVNNAIYQDNDTWALEAYTGNVASLSKLSYSSNTISSMQTCKIKNLKTGKYLDVSGMSFYDDGRADVLAYSSNTGLNQKFILKYNSGSTYEIVPFYYHDGALDISGASSSIGANLQMYHRNDTNAQKFVFTRSYDMNGTTIYNIKTVCSGNTYGLIPENYSTGDASVKQGNYKNIFGDWIIEKFTDSGFQFLYRGSYYSFQNRSNSAYMTVKNGSSSNNTQLILGSNGTYNYQKFQYSSYTDGTVMLIPGHNSSKAVRSGAGLFKENMMAIYDINTSNKNQFFKFVYLGNGYCKIYTEDTNFSKVINTKDSSTSTSAELRQENDGDSYTMQWKIIPR